MLRLVMVAVGIFATGCATIQPEIQVARTGAINTGEEARLSQAAWEAEPASTDVFDAVDSSFHGDVLPPEWGLGDGFDVLGTLVMDFDAASRRETFKNLYWTWSYRTTARKAVCWPQVPFKIVTLGLWIIVPTAWPCIAHLPSSADRRALFVEYARRAAAVLGGDAVVIVQKDGLAGAHTVVTRFGNVTTADSQAYEMHDMRWRGVVLRRKRPARGDSTDDE